MTKDTRHTDRGKEQRKERGNVSGTEPGTEYEEYKRVTRNGIFPILFPIECQCTVDST